MDLKHLVMYNPKNNFDYLIAKLNSQTIRHQVHRLASGIIVIDIWHENNFYVIDLAPDFAGVSTITTENPGFTTEPDEKFYDDELFRARLDLIFG